MRMTGSFTPRHPPDAGGADDAIIERDGLETRAADDIIMFGVLQAFTAGEACVRKENIKDNVFNPMYHIYL